jgi:hypothetical protein
VDLLCPKINPESGYNGYRPTKKAKEFINKHLQEQWQTAKII